MMETGNIASRVGDMLSSLDRRAICYSRFLDEGELLEAERSAKGAGCFYLSYGGFAGAERKVLCVCSYAEPLTEEFPVVALCFRLSNKTDISHRDVLGALMSLGIKREFIGDIVFTDEQCVFFVYDSVSALIMSELSSVGRFGVKPAVFDGDFVYERKTEQMDCIVSSLRIDCVLSAVLHLSRDASEQVLAGRFVKINGIECTKRDKQVAPGDVFSVRRAGKFKVGDIEGKTRKDRIKLTIYKYI